MQEKLESVKLCTACKEEMVLEVASYPMGSVFKSDRLEVDIYRCPKCDHVKLFAAREKRDLITCPVCGATHHPHEKCAVCALNNAYELYFGKKE